MEARTLAQNGPLKGPGAAKPQRTWAYKIVGSWRVARLWMRFLLVGPRLGVRGVVDFVIGNHFFRAMQVPSELAALGDVLAERQPKRALEIGTAHGGTLLFLTHLANPQATIVSVDLPGGTFGGGYGPRRRWFYQRFARRGQRLILLQGDSHSIEMLGRVKAVFGGQALDYLFIDGDHRYEGVRHDFEMYGPLVRKGGVIAFHDIVDGRPDLGGGVPAFWRDVKSRYRHDEFVQDPRQGGWGIGVLYVDG